MNKPPDKHDMLAYLCRRLLSKLRDPNPIACGCWALLHFADKTMGALISSLFFCFEKFQNTAISLSFSLRFSYFKITPTLLYSFFFSLLYSFRSLCNWIQENCVLNVISEPSIQDPNNRYLLVSSVLNLEFHLF